MAGAPHGLMLSRIQRDLPRPLPVTRTAAGVPEVTATWVAALGEDQPCLVVDVRQPGEWNDELGHIADAHLVPLAQLASAAASWDRRLPIVTVCRSGGRSGHAALLLEQLGFHDVASMRGGMLEWDRAGLRVVKPGGGRPRSS